mmetsp:Transcript_19491/g.50718  ORF Transcript_19491/g.50718 Transcript_19491/m.50718 type:complete len:387 (-) Transcript_19491:47-1207(-)
MTAGTLRTGRWAHAVLLAVAMAVAVTVVGCGVWWLRAPGTFRCNGTPDQPSSERSHFCLCRPDSAEPLCSQPRGAVDGGTRGKCEYILWRGELTAAFQPSSCRDCRCSSSSSSSMTAAPPASNLEVMPWDRHTGPYPPGRAVSPCIWVPFNFWPDSQVCVHQGDALSETLLLYGRSARCDTAVNLWHNQSGVDGVHLEIGANIGGCIVDMLIRTNAQIIAFEPNPVNLYRLTSTLLALPSTLSDRVTLYPVALGEATTRSKLFVATHDFTNGVLGRRVRMRGNDDFFDAVPVPVWPLDAVVDTAVAIRSVNIDVMGAECDVIKGGMKSLRRALHGSALRIRVSARHLNQTGCTLDRVYGLVSDAHYRDIEPLQPPYTATVDVVGYK